jgi:hypothetical protein
LQGEDRQGVEGDGGSIFWKTREKGLPSYNDPSTVLPKEQNVQNLPTWGDARNKEKHANKDQNFTDGILGHQFNKRLDCFAPCYSQTLLLADLKEKPYSFFSGFYNTVLPKILRNKKHQVYS